MRTKQEIAAAAFEAVEQSGLDAQTRAAYVEEVQSVLASRLDQELYLTCEDFGVFDVQCCDICHGYQSHHEMWWVDLVNGQHAWICDPIKSLLTCLQQQDSNPDHQRAEALSAEILGVDELSFEARFDGMRSVMTDGQKVRSTLACEQSVFGRLRNDPFDEVVACTLEFIKSHAPVEHETDKHYGLQ